MARAGDSLSQADLQAWRSLQHRQRRTVAWGRSLLLGSLVLGCLYGCSLAVGRVVGQRFVSPAYDFEVPLPGDAWTPVADEHAVLTLTHPYLAGGITINVTCDRERQLPLNILTRHLFFGFKDMAVLQQERLALHGIPALKTVARAQLDSQEVQLNSYVIQQGGCVYDLVYFASPQDYPRGEADFERLVSGWRFLN